MGVWSFGGNTPCDRPRAESCNAVGGTWDLFRYPGICSDSDMYTFGYSFRPWELDPAIADGESIRSYIRETAAAYGVDRKIRFQHRVRRACHGHWPTRFGRSTTCAEPAKSRPVSPAIFSLVVASAPSMPPSAASISLLALAHDYFAAVPSIGYLYSLDHHCFELGVGQGA